MSAALLVLSGQTARQKAAKWCLALPMNTRVTFAEPKRSLPQNDMLHAILTRLALRQTWHGQRLTVTDWKRLLTAGMDRELRLVPNIQGDGFIALGRPTSEMSKAELSDLIEYTKKTAADFGWDIEDHDETTTKDRSAPNKAGRRVAA